MNVQGGVESQLVRGITSTVAHGVPRTCCCCFVPRRACAIQVLGDLFTCSHMHKLAAICWKERQIPDALTKSCSV